MRKNMYKWVRKKSCILLLVGLISCLGLLSACGAQQSKDQSNTKQKDGEQEVVIALSSVSEPENGFDPILGWGTDASPIIQSTLVAYDNHMQIKKDLATDYKLSADHLTWLFTLRDDAVFTDGQPVTAEDVAFTFEQAKRSHSAVDLHMVERVQAVDKNQVAVTLKKPQITFLNTVATIGIVPKHAYTKEYGEKPVGSGPYQLVQWNKGEQVILKANPKYYGKKPSLSKVTLVFMDEDASYAAAKSGEVDVALVAATQAQKKIAGMHLADIKTQDNRGITLPVTASRGEVNEDGYPVGNNVTADPAIRQALVYGLDREEMAKNTVNGYAVPAYSEDDGMPWNNPETKVKTDVAYAKRLLSEAGWKRNKNEDILEKNGEKAAFTLYYLSGDSVRQAIAMDAAEQAKRLGIKIHVTGSNWDEISKEMFSNAVLMGWGSSNPYTSYLLFHGSNKLKADYYNPEGFDLPVVNQYLDQALAAGTQEEANEYFKKAQWDGQTGTSMLKEAPWVWLVNIDHLYYVRDGLDIGKQPLHPHGSSWPLLQNLNEWCWK